MGLSGELKNQAFGFGCDCEVGTRVSNKAGFNSNFCRDRRPKASFQLWNENRSACIHVNIV